MAKKKIAKSAVLTGEYGAPLLKRLAQKYTGLGLAIAIAIHFIGVGAYWGAQYLGREDDNAPMVRVLTYSELGPPPSITHQQALPKVAVMRSFVMRHIIHHR